MKRPSIKSPCVADQYHAAGERIAEFAFTNGRGGLLSLRELADGSTVLEVYRHDAGVEVRAGNPRDWTDTAPAVPAQWAPFVDFVRELARCGYSANRDRAVQLTDQARGLELTLRTGK